MTNLASIPADLLRNVSGGADDSPGLSDAWHQYDVGYDQAFWNNPHSVWAHPLKHAEYDAAAARKRHDDFQAAVNRGGLIGAIARDRG